MVNSIALVLSALVSADLLFLPFRPEQIPADEISSLYQDSDGYIWIVSYSGLSRYDGYRTVSYTIGPDSDDAQTIQMHSVIEASDGLYIATENGLLCLDRKTGQISTVPDPLISGMNISAMTIDGNGRLWVGGDKGIFVRNGNGVFTASVFSMMPGDRPITDVVNMVVDHSGDLWFTSWGRGLFRFDMDQSRLYSYTEGDFSASYVLHEDSREGMWIGTWGRGLLYMKDLDAPDSPASYVRYAHGSRNPGSILDDIIYNIREDGDGNVWIGSRSGLSILERKAGGGFEDRFINKYPEEGEGNLPYNEVNSILRTRDNSMWVGMLGGGICKVEEKPRIEERFPMTKVRAEYKTASIKSIYPTGDGKMWLGITGHGLIQYDSHSGDFVHYSSLPEFEGMMYTSIVECIRERSATREICFGSYNTGIWLYNPETGETNVLNSANCSALTQDSILSIAEDGAGNMWLGTRHGIFVLAPDNTVTPFQEFISRPRLENGYKAQSMSIDLQGNIWVATGYDGILKIDPTAGEVTSYTVNGPSEVRSFNSVLADSKGNIWAGSALSGLYRFDSRRKTLEEEKSLIFLSGKGIANISEDPHGNIWVSTSTAVLSFKADENGERKILSYDVTHGQEGSVFCNRNSAFYMEDTDEMAFGTSRGIVLYPCTPSSEDIGTRTIQITDIRHGENVYKDLVISFSIFDFESPEDDIYAYRLTRRGKTPGQWSMVGGGDNRAVFTSLKPGNYIFEVYGYRSGHTAESDICRMDIKIPGNPWLSWWAITMYVLLASGIILWLVLSASSRMKMKRQLELETLNQQKADEINQARLQFFTNISHEFLTPLSIILASAESLEPKTGKDKNITEIMSANALRLTRMVQQVLDFRKVESDNMELKVSENDIAEFISHEVESFIPLVRKHQLTVSFSSDPQSIRGWFDPDKLDKIIYNLLSNAVKYTPAGGTVRLSVNLRNDNSVEITCANSGRLMSRSTISKLFKRFYEGDYRHFNTIGNGIGLSLVKSLVTMHKGTIDVVSNEKDGNCFTVSLPIGKDSYTETEIDTDTSGDNHMPFALSLGENVARTGYTVLCIDDNEELCELLQAILSKSFNVLTSQSAEDALEILKDNAVDVIVCDVAMPGMDGFQFCAKIKEAVEYSHIPVILLTAKTDPSYSIEGFRSGADGYLTKPCNFSVLSAMILNLIGKQEKKGEAFRKQLVFEVPDIDYTSVDKKFLQKAIDVVNAHIADSEFSQTDFVREMSVSRTVLTEKLKNLTGFTPSAFILNARLTLAYKLLCEEKGNIRVSDLAYSVGFSDAKYFSKCFKKKYNKTPKAVMEEHMV